jgi:acetylornithine deacetylase/succinyl-diaminopimelate desuccinylase-like protein
VLTDPTLVSHFWTSSAVPSLEDYVRIPNQSPAFDVDWAKNGLLDRAVHHVADWCRAEVPNGTSVDLLQLGDLTPMIVMELIGRGAAADRTVLLYGHVDKQPPMDGWRDDLGPYDPVVHDGKLYGRGGADDGYAAYACVTALRALVASGRDRARCVVLIEASEESGSPDLPVWLDHLADLIGVPDLVVCLDSGCGNYEQLWATTSLRGLVGGALTVEALTEAVHSGDAGGIVPDTFRIARSLLARVEDAQTGGVLLPAAAVEIPAERRVQAAAAASALGSELVTRFPWVDGVEPPTDDLVDAVLARTWRPSLAVHGADGLPPVAEAGNILRPSTRLRLSVRIPPTSDANAVQEQLASALTTDIPQGVRVTFDPDFVASGWEAPPLAPWLSTALEEASQHHFDRPACFMGEGGTIPFMAMLGERFPEAQFFITGVLGPGSNAHGPNEFLHLDYARRLVSCVADVLAVHGHS